MVKDRKIKKDTRERTRERDNVFFNVFYICK